MERRRRKGVISITLLVVLSACMPLSQPTQINCTPIKLYLDNCSNTTIKANETIYINQTEYVYKDTCNSTYTLKLIQQIKRMESRALRYRNCTDQGYDFDKINESLEECKDRICELNRSSCGQGT